MTYADFEMAMAYFWGLYALVLLWGILWSLWVFLWDEPMTRRRARRAARPDA